MIGTGYIKRMARYNCWQNENLYSCADRLPDEARRQERGAFFGSIHGTLNHLLWADEIWMSRFCGTPRPPGGLPESTSLRAGWDELKRDRDDFDRRIIAWATISTVSGSQAIIPIIRVRRSGTSLSRDGCS